MKTKNRVIFIILVYFYYFNKLNLHPLTNDFQKGLF